MNNIIFRPAQPDDIEFARNVYYITMREYIEPVMGWNQAKQDASFSSQFKTDEIQIISLDGKDMGWIQTQKDLDTFNLGQIYLVPELQGKGIGSEIISRFLDDAKKFGKMPTLSVMKNNPARSLYERHGFRATREDDYKVYMQWIGAEA